MHYQNMILYYIKFKKNERTKKTEQKFHVLPLIAYIQQARAALSTEAFGSTYEELEGGGWYLAGPNRNSIKDGLEHPKAPV